MSQNTKNPIKIKRRNLQDFYSHYFSAAMAMSGIFLFLIIASIMSIVSLDPASTAIATIAIFLIFLPFNGYFTKKNQIFFVKTPAWISERAFKIIGDATILLVILSLIIGILFFPYSPIESTARGYTDKIGNLHSAAEYAIFQKWVATYYFLWAIGALQSFIYIPLAQWRSRDWWKHFLK